MRRSTAAAALASPLLLAVAAGTALTTAGPLVARASAAPPHVMVIVMENTAYDAAHGSPYIVGNAAAPYLNKTLLTTYTSATSWYSVEHVSDYDYYDLISGADQKGLSKPVSGTTFVDQLASKGVSWKAYMEDMPSVCYTGGQSGNYVKGHNPFVGFKSIVNNPAQCNNDVPYSQSTMTSDLNQASPPSFVWITPNNCDNMHSSCSGGNVVTQGDNWLKATIPAVQGTAWYKSGGIIVVTWDESVTSDSSGAPGTSDSGGKIATLVISSTANSAYAPAGDHFGTLRGLENAYGVGCLVAACQSAHGDLSGAFHLGGGGGPGAISGTVTDAGTSAPISGVSVSCPTCPTTAATTNGSGVYSFSSVPSGNYSLSFSKSGYVSKNNVPVSVSAGNTTTQNEALTSSNHQPIFSDGFESGDVSGWTANSGSTVTVETSTVHTGTYAARAVAANNAAYVQKALPATYTTAYLRVWAFFTSQSTKAVLLKAGTSSNSTVALVYVNSKGLLGLQAADGSNHDSTTPMPTGGWHELELGLTVGAAGSADVWLDGTDVLHLAKVNLKSIPVAAMQLGDATAHTWNATFDDAAFDTQQIP